LKTLPDPSSGKAGRPWGLLALVPTLALATACASPLPYAKPLDPLSLLSRDALAYIHVAKTPLAGLVPAIVTPAELESLSPLLARSDSADLAILPPPSAAAGKGGQPSSLDLSQRPRFEAAFLGDYPWRSAALALGNDKAWKKSPGGKAWLSPALGLGIAFADSRLLLAASSASGPGTKEGIDGLVEGLALPKPSPIPPALSALASRDLVLWAPEPFVRLGAALLGREAQAAGEDGEGFDVPAIGVLISGSPSGSAILPPAGTKAGQEELVYELSVVFLMKDSEEARIYRPALRLAWYGLSKLLFPGEEGIASLRFELSGNMVLASGFRMRASVLAGGLRAMAAAGRAGRAD
jgi:hypothetical protein